MKNRSFSLQWHLTALCDQNCKHCYMKDQRTYFNEINNQLDTKQCERVIDDFLAFCSKINAQPHIAFTGGDPLLRKDFFEILEYSIRNRISSSIMGNPFHLNEANLDRFQKLKIRGYQLSIDGTEEYHDSFRKAGSYRATVEAIKALQKHKIRTVVMFSLSKENASYLIPVMRLVSQLEVDVFAFARVCGYGSGKNLLSKSLTPEEYRALLLQVYEEEKRLKNMGSQTWFNKKDHLWTLLLHELRINKLNPMDNDTIYSGCSLGCRSIALLADGTVFACRRFYSPIGNVLEQKIENIFVSDQLNSYRDAELQKCSKCELYQFCRGCPAVAFGESGVFGSPDPQCWKKIT